MKQGFMQEHWSDENGNPAGGVSSGTGFTVSWQSGPLKWERARLNTGLELDLPIPPNGAFARDVLDAVIGRIEFYQGGRFKSAENEKALYYLKKAAVELARRTQIPEARGVEGTHNE